MMLGPLGCAMAQCDTAQVQAAVKKADEQIWSDHKKAMSFALQAVSNFKGKGSYCEGKTLFVLGKTLWSNGDYEESAEVLRRAIMQARNAGDSETEARCQLVMANDYYYQAYYDSAEKHFEESRRSFLKIAHRTGLIEVLHDMALMNHRKGDFKSSLRFLLESERLKELEPDFIHYVGDFSGISTGFIDSMYYQQEIKDELNSLRNFRNNNNPDGVYQSLINLGIAYRELGDHRTAARYIVKGSKHMATLGVYPFWDLAGVEYGKAGMPDSSFYYHYKAKAEFPRATQIKILYTYELLGNAHRQFNNPDSALWYYEKSMAMNQAMNNRLTVAGLHLSLARLFYEKNNMEVAERHLEEALQRSSGISVKLISNCYQFATEFYKAKAPSKALQYAMQYQSLSDSINRNEIAMAMIRFQTQFDTERKQRDLDAAKLKLKNRTIIVLSLAISTILSLAFVAVLVLQQKKAKKLNESLNESNEIQKALIQEIHHRIKNNLQYIVSLLSLQMHHVNNSELLTQMEEVKTRIMTIGLIHQNLYQSKSLQYVELPIFIDELVRNIFQAFPTSRPLKEDIRIQPLYLDLESSISVGLLVNELVSNSLKHALMHHPEPAYTLQIHMVDKVLQILSIDNGPGFSWSDQTKGFGVRLIGLLLRKLDGEVTQPAPNTISITIRNFDLKTYS